MSQADPPPSTQDTNGPGVGASVDLGSAPVTPEGTRQRLQQLRRQGAGQRYELRDEVGRGGMGAVLEVFDPALRRSLAMKVVLGRDQQEPGAEIDPERLGRFLEEAQITGQLDHPGVVPVHELGVGEDGRAYFTMSLVRGVELSRIIERVHAGDPAWTLTRALGVLLRVCETMAFAHQKKVVHRDLKPSNVMVGRHGEVYVMDWGLARVEGAADARDLRPRAAEASVELHTDRADARASDLESPLVTRDGTVLGTPHYMPPEQAQGRTDLVDACSDVYSVGSMLYHLLTGLMPYQVPGVRPSAHTILARVLAGPPPAVHELARDVPAELVAICEKAMAREREQRYGHMGALAEDLRAYLENRVVRAHRTGPVVELQKWVQRNRPLAFASAAAVLLALLGLGTTNAVLASGKRALAGKNEELRAKNDELEVARNAALASAERADAEAARARREEATAQRVVDFMVAMFEADDPFGEGGSSGERLLVRDVLDRAAAGLRVELEEDPWVRARLQHSLGQVYSNIGLYGEADVQLDSAGAVYDGLGDDAVARTLAAQGDLALLRERQGRFDEAEPLLLEVLAWREAELGPGHADTLAMRANLASLRHSQGRLDEAGELYEAVLADSAQHLGGDHRTTTTIRANRAALLQAQGKFGEARTELLDLRERRRTRLGALHPETLAISDQLASLLVREGHHDEAAELLKEVVAEKRAVLGESHPSTLSSLSNLGVLERTEGRYAKAEPILEEVLERRRLRLGADHPTTILSMGNLGQLYILLGRLDEAEALLVVVAEKHREGLGPRHPSAITSLSNLAWVYQNQGRLDDAEAIYLDLLELGPEVLGEEHPETLVHLNNLAELYRKQGRMDEARALYEECIAKHRRILGEYHTSTLVAEHNIAGLHRDEGDLARAREIYEDVLERMRSVLDAEHPYVLGAMNNLGEVLQREKRYEEALPLLEESYAGHMAALGEDNQSTITSMHNLGILLARLERWEDSEALLLDALEKRERLNGLENEGTQHSIETMDKLYQRWDEALEGDGAESAARTELRSRAAEFRTRYGLEDTP